VKLIGLLSWFDEPVDTLVDNLRSMAKAGVDHIVAVDGRYALFPADYDLSHPNEYAAILLACRGLGMGCTIHQPSGPWEGGEVEKRTALFAAGWAVAEPGDWFWVQDADQVVIRTPEDFKQRLERSEHDVADVRILDVVALRADQPDWPAFFSMHALFRAQPITVGPAHCQYRAEDGTLLWGYEGDARLATALDLSDVVLVEHRPDRRPAERLRAKMVYYSERDAAGIERGACELCDGPSTGLVPARWRLTELGPVADWMECCDEHAASVDAVNALELRKLGIDPASVVVENRNGHAPAAV
jgi:hypothetical protein